VTLVHLLTGERMPKPDPETHLLAAELGRRGVSAPVVAWTDPAAGHADVVLIRTTWDYTSRREEFVEWCELTAERALLLNPPAIVRWNSHKGYLRELAAAGVPTVPTEVVAHGADASVGAGEVVIKPAVSSGAFGAGRFAAGDPAAREHLLGVLETGDAIIQPYLPSVAAQGERSLIYLGGELSHAVNKRPAAGDYRVQSHYGGAVARHDPSAAELAAAQAALAHVDGTLTYARVDLVHGRAGPMVIELELIEPELFLGIEPSAPARLAELVAGYAAHDG
jgi:glutathione synthase/RimK-type ligase-like ATP-grasp enzyme